MDINDQHETTSKDVLISTYWSEYNVENHEQVVDDWISSFNESWDNEDSTLSILSYQSQIIQNDCANQSFGCSIYECPIVESTVISAKKAATSHNFLTHDISVLPMGGSFYATPTERTFLLGKNHALLGSDTPSGTPVSYMGYDVYRDEDSSVRRLALAYCNLNYDGGDVCESYIDFYASENESGPMLVEISAYCGDYEAGDSQNLFYDQRTTNRVIWEIPGIWQKGMPYRTPDLSCLINESKAKSTEIENYIVFYFSPISNGLRTINLKSNELSALHPEHSDGGNTVLPHESPILMYYTNTPMGAKLGGAADVEWPAMAKIKLGGNATSYVVQSCLMASELKPDKQQRFLRLIETDVKHAIGYEGIEKYEAIEDVTQEDHQQHHPVISYLRKSTNPNHSNNRTEIVRMYDDMEYELHDGVFNYTSSHCFLTFDTSTLSMDDLNHIHEVYILFKNDISSYTANPIENDPLHELKTLERTANQLNPMLMDISALPSGSPRDTSMSYRDGSYVTANIQSWPDINVSYRTQNILCVVEEFIQQRKDGEFQDEKITLKLVPASLGTRRLLITNGYQPSINLSETSSQPKLVFVLKGESERDIYPTGGVGIGGSARLQIVNEDDICQNKERTDVNNLLSYNHDRFIYQSGMGRTQSRITYIDTNIHPIDSQESIEYNYGLGNLLLSPGEYINNKYLGQGHYETDGFDDFWVPSKVGALTYIEQSLACPFIIDTAVRDKPILDVYLRAYRYKEHNGDDFPIGSMENLVSIKMLSEITLLQDDFNFDPISNTRISWSMNPWTEGNKYFRTPNLKCLLDDHFNLISRPDQETETFTVRIEPKSLGLRSFFMNSEQDYLELGQNDRFLFSLVIIYEDPAHGLTTNGESDVSQLYFDYGESGVNLDGECETSMNYIMDEFGSGGIQLSCLSEVGQSWSEENPIGITVNGSINEQYIANEEHTVNLTVPENAADELNSVSTIRTYEISSNGLIAGQGWNGHWQHDVVYNETSTGGLNVSPIAEYGQSTFEFNSVTAELSGEAEVQFIANIVGSDVSYDEGPYLSGHGALEFFEEFTGGVVIQPSYGHWRHYEIPTGGVIFGGGARYSVLHLWLEVESCESNFKCGFRNSDQYCAEMLKIQGYGSRLDPNKVRDYGSIQLENNGKGSYGSSAFLPPITLCRQKLLPAKNQPEKKYININATEVL